MASSRHRRGRGTSHYRNWWLVFAGFMLVVTLVRLGFALGEARDARDAEHLAQRGVSGVATRCEYRAEAGEAEAILLTYVADGQTFTAEPLHARIEDLYGWNWDVELEDGRRDITRDSGYSCPVAIRWDPEDPRRVAAQQDVQYVASGLERDSAMEDLSVFAVITLLAGAMWLLVSTARRAHDRRGRLPGSRHFQIGLATLLTGAVAFMNVGSVIELLSDQEPVREARLLNERGASATASSCRVLVRDGWGHQVVVTFQGEGRTHTVPLSFVQELGGDGYSEFELPDCLHESPERSIYLCPLDVRYDPREPSRVMAQRDVVYFFEGGEQRWNVAVLTGWSTASLATASLWVMWWPPRSRRDEWGA